ncbi:MAG: ATP-dependent RecD-like DNA helicase [Candidatus Aminicenantales bacterium]
MSEYLEGTVERIVYYSPDSGYTVLKFVLEDGKTMTLVGNFPPLSPGELMKVKGAWEINPRFGQQFRVENYLPILPSSVRGIEKFLSSGLIKGIGPVLARRIVKHFGQQTIGVLNKSPHKLREVEGVGPSKLVEIKKAWAEHREIRDLIIFLQEHNVSTSMATKIYNRYREKSYQVLKTNPYQLSFDIWGIGFRTADQIALKLGMDPSSLERVKAFVLYLLEKDNEKGHVFSYQKEVEIACQKELEVNVEKVKKALEELRKQKLVTVEELKSGADNALYLPFFYQAQEEIAQAFSKLASFPCSSPPFDVEKAISGVEEEMGITFSLKQKLAIRKCFEVKILVITGGPGTGKTTIIKAVVDIFEKWGREVKLTAPTGRAAKRLSEATRSEAKTIHRTLEYNPKSGNFRRNENRPLRADALIIDEFSMVDLPLMYYVVKALPDWIRLILVGDKDQLPSVGPGTLLKDLIDSKKVEVVRLDEIFRQEKDSLIVINAHRVNQGLSLIYPQRGDRDSDFYFIHQENEEKIFQKIIDLCCYRIPQKLRLSPLSPEIQVISPMYRGMVGVDRLNTELQKQLNPGQRGLKVGARELRTKDKVMQIRNNYEKEVFNGDIGNIIHVDRDRYRIVVNFYGRHVPYMKEELGDLTLAYAVSVHKSQGSEYQAVIMPLLTQHFIMLQRNLFYTALTRAKKLSIIIGSYRALHIAIKNDKPVKRNCILREKLVEICS